ncbi:MAG TPA: multicopper oxidase domain-containing protein [Candidatus Eisenbacteria bacterium]|jgi:FtsP/CotA-like multicopper oxidase with cupredoxin domain
MPSRRDFLRASLLMGGAAMLPRWSFADGGSGDRPFPSPFLRPFALELPLPPVVRQAAPFSTRRFVPPGTVFHDIRGREAQQRVHPDLPPTTVWGYEDVNAPGAPVWPGVTIVGRAGTPRLVRFRNELPADHRGFGVPNLVVHRHGGVQLSEDDGFPTDIFRPGESRDFFWPDGRREGLRDETQGTLWYHDHLVDFTSQNVYKGLAAFYVRYSDVDPGNENNPGPRGLRLPSGPFDVAFVIQDRVFNGDGSLFYDPAVHDGFLGDTFLVNGAVQPFFRVKRRKYRFRILNGSNARFYELFLSSGQPFVQIATEGGFFESPLTRRSILIAPAERVEIIVDFSAYPQGAQIVLENRLKQDNGRGPDGPAAFPTPLMRFDVDGTAPDASVIPNRLRDPFPTDPFPPRNRRLFEFARSNGGWVVNEQFFDANRSVAQPRLDDVELWTLKNGGGGWWHPIHIHLSLFELLRRNGAPPQPFERAMKDTIVLGPGDEVDLRMQFTDFRGRYVFHCHNLEHEDMAMMARFDTV